MSSDELGFTRRNGRRVHRLSGPAELLEAVPYLLGFHPRDSLVLVGLHLGDLVVTARLDLSDAPAAVPSTLAAMMRGGATAVVAVIWDDGATPVDIGALPWTDLAHLVADEVLDARCEPVDLLFVSRSRWWSYTCGDAGCCPPQGRELPTGVSAFAAEATYAGIVALPDRQALADLLAPEPPQRRARLQSGIADAENAAVAAVLDGQGARHERSVKRAIFAAARASSTARWAPPDDTEVARFGVALSETVIRDAVWLAVDDGRLDGRELWRYLARTLPAPYDAPAMFLFGWRCWRSGDGALAGMAAERVLLSSPEYHVADLLLAALSHGVDPRRLCRLRRPA